MKILLTGGGTAGHVYPALAMAEIIKAKYPDAEFLFIGRRGGNENDIPLRAGIPVREIDAAPIDRKNLFKAAKGLIGAIRSISEAKAIMREFSPRLVIGTGGYVSWPVITAARWLRVKRIIHESNAYPGLVTRTLSPKCNLTLLGFRVASKHLKRGGRVEYLGNPTRRDFRATSRKEARRRLGIPSSAFLTVSFGGSLGAEAMNTAISAAITPISKSHHAYIHLHAAGKRYYEQLIREHPELSGRHGSRIVPYIENVPLWFSAADLAITRSGAITLAELSASGLPAILIPSPNVADDHQSANARAAAESGGAITLPESELTPERIREEIERLIDNPDVLRRMRDAHTPCSAAGIDEAFIGYFDEIYPF